MLDFFVKMAVVFNFVKHSCSHFYDAMKYSVKLEVKACLQTVLFEVNKEILK